MNGSVEVPIILSPDHLSYEDIAKLNPFYEEYRAFLNASANASTNRSSLSSYQSASSSSMMASSSSSSSRSTHSDIDLSFHASEIACSSMLDPIPSSHKMYVPERLHVHQSKPSYEVPTTYDVSHIATLEYEDTCQQEILPAVPSKSREIDLLDFALVDGPVQQPKGSHKKLFGQNGLLGPVEELPTEKTKPKIFKSLGKKIKQHVEEIAGDVAKAYPGSLYQPRRSKMVPKSTAQISLDPPTQAKLYSEMEVMICVSANKFLVQQYNDGRLSVDSIKKINSFWGSKNRPQVVEFQFDQATQRRLILSNIRTLHFDGESSTNPILLNSNLHNWKAIVKEMSVRTFCAPDSVIRKHLHDIHKLLDMLGAPTPTFLAFEDLQMKTLSMMKEHLKRSYRQTGDTTISSMSNDSMLSRALVCRR